jgi:hypothetical protein
MNLEENIPRNIFDKDADYNIFTSVIDTDANSKNVFFNCQILKTPNTIPSLIIHGI